MVPATGCQNQKEREREREREREESRNDGRYKQSENPRIYESDDL